MTHARRLYSYQNQIRLESNKAQIILEAAELSASLSSDFYSPTIDTPPKFAPSAYFLPCGGPSCFSMLKVIAKVHFDSSISYKIDRKVRIKEKKEKKKSECFLRKKNCEYLRRRKA